MKTIPDSRHSTSEPVAFLEFFGSSLGIAAALYFILRLALPAAFFGDHSRFIALLGFLIGAAISAKVFDIVSRRRHH